MAHITRTPGEVRGGGGFSNLLRRENTMWWRTGRWLIFGGLAALAAGGFTVMVLFVVPQVAATQGDIIPPDEALEAGINSFFGLLFLGGAVAAVILTQDTIIGEKQSGTAEWVLSKPVSRSAYIWAKLIANALGLLASVVVLPALVGYVIFTVYTGGLYPIGLYLGAVALLALHTLFYLVLSLMMGVFTEQRGVLLAVTLGSALGGAALANVLGTVALVTPWTLVNIAGAVAVGATLPPLLALPVISTVLLTAAALATALVQFNRVDL